MERLLPRLALAASFSLGLCLTSTFSPSAQAAIGDEEEELLGYDTIIRNLNRETAEPSGRMRARMADVSKSDPFEGILFHGGIGMPALMQSISLEDGSRIYMDQTGIQAAFGIDLFSQNWMAEGTARSFGESDESSATRASLQEFELKVIYKERWSKHLGLRAGAGLSARYLRIKQLDREDLNYTTPSSLASVGLDFFLSDRMSIGADINGRNALIAETIDHNSVDATIRLDTHF